MTDKEILENIKKYNWYHEIEVKDGITTNAVDALEVDGNYNTRTTVNTESADYDQQGVFLDPTLLYQNQPIYYWNGKSGIATAVLSGISTLFVAPIGPSPI